MTGAGVGGGGFVTFGFSLDNLLFDMGTPKNMNGLATDLKIDEVPVKSLEEQYNALGALIAERKEHEQRAAAARAGAASAIGSSTSGRMKALGWLAVFGVLIWGLYDYIILNDLSMRPIDMASLEKMVITLISFVLGLLVVERSLKYFVPYLYHYFVNDNESDKDFTTHLKDLKPFELICVTCFFIGLFFWGFVQILTVRW